MSQRALIIEDRPEIALLYSRALVSLEFEISYAQSLREAYSILSETAPPELVILDLNLSQFETAEFTVRQITNLKKYNPEMVVIVVSGVLTPELTKVAFEQGAMEVKEKVDWRMQVDIWKTLEHCFNNSPTKTKDRLKHSLELLQKLLPLMLLFIGRLKL